jgi:FkbM family methyltransferase
MNRPDQRSPLGVIKSLLGREPYCPPEEEAYRRLRAKGFKPASIVDVGAYHGDWTRLARRVFDEVPVLMVEAQAGKIPMLEKVCADVAQTRYVSAVLGRTEGQEVMFYEMETGSSFLPERSNVDRVERRMITQTLDKLTEAMPGPLLLKVDVQGAELEVLAGGSATLAKSEVVQLEVALLPYNEGAPSMLGVLTAMDAMGFVPFDISGFSRPNGVDLVQVDIVFAKRESSFRPQFFEF